MRLLSLLVLAGILSACGANRPKLTFCVMRAEDEKLYCTDPKGVQFELLPREADKYVCLSQRDQESLLNYVVELEKKAARSR